MDIYLLMETTLFSALLLLLCCTPSPIASDSTLNYSSSTPVPCWRHILATCDACSQATQQKRKKQRAARVQKIQAQFFYFPGSWWCGEDAMTFCCIKLNDVALEVLDIYLVTAVDCLDGQQTLVQVFAFDATYE